MKEPKREGVPSATHPYLSLSFHTRKMGGWDFSPSLPASCEARAPRALVWVEGPQWLTPAVVTKSMADAS